MYEFQSQTSVRFDGVGGIRPPDPPPGSAIVKLNERIGISVGHLVENDQNAINVGQRLDIVHGQVCKSYSQKSYKTDLKPNRLIRLITIACTF